MIIQIGVVTFLVIGAIYDIKTREVPNVITNSLLGLALLLSIYTFSLPDLFVNLTIAAVVYGAFYITKFLGGADVKGMLIIILALGANYYLGFLYYMFLFSAITFIFFWTIGKKLIEDKNEIPLFVPMAVSAGWLLIGGGL